MAPAELVDGSPAAVGCVRNGLGNVFESGGERRGEGFWLLSDGFDDHIRGHGTSSPVFAPQGLGQAGHPVFENERRTGFGAHAAIPDFHDVHNVLVDLRIPHGQHFLELDGGQGDHVLLHFHEVRDGELGLLP